MTTQHTQWITDESILWLICIHFFNVYIELSKLNHMFECDLFCWFEFIVNVLSSGPLAVSHRLLLLCTSRKREIICKKWKHIWKKTEVNGSIENLHNVKWCLLKNGCVLVGYEWLDTIRKVTWSLLHLFIFKDKVSKNIWTLCSLCRGCGKSPTRTLYEWVS